MRILVASFVVAVGVAAACGSSPKKDTGIVQEGSDTAATCCCKTIPVTDDKEIRPQFAMAPRMECSTSNGDCVPDVQCNGSAPAATPTGDGVPPPPPVTPAASAPNAL